MERGIVIGRRRFVLLSLLLLAAVFSFSSRERLVDSGEGPYMLAEIGTAHDPSSPEAVEERQHQMM